MTQEASPATGGSTARAKFPDKLVPLSREIDPKSIQIRKDGDKTSITFPASSEAPVERWFGSEVLSHESGAVRMDRINRGAAPLLFNHNWDDPIGMIDGARIEDKRLVVDAHFFNTDRANEIRAMLDGGLRNVSIGYRLHTVEEDVDEQTYTARDWEPFEVSVVTVPADPSVGVGRSLGQELEVRMHRASPPVPQTLAQPAKGVSMPEVQAPAAGAPNAETQKLSAVQADQNRREAVSNYCRAFKIDKRVEAQWLEDGTPLEEISKELIRVVEERGKAKPTDATNIGLTGKEAQKFSLFRAIRAMRWGGQEPKFLQDAAYELECSRTVAKQLGRDLVGNRLLVPGEVLTRPIGQEAATRAMATQPGSKGGYMVGVEVMGFIDILRNRSCAMRMGARVLSGLTGNVAFPRQTGKVSVTWQAGEGTSVTAADQALGQLSMTPKTCIAITDVSEQLLAQASPSAESFIMADLAADVAIDGVDAAVLNGTGGAQPIGIKNTSGITSGQDASSATYAKILAFVSTAGASNAIRGNPGWVTTTAGAARLMQVQRFSSTDTPLWTGNMLDGQLVGFNAMSTEQAASGNIFFGSWDEVVIGEWGVLELSTDNGGTRFNQAQVGIRAMWMVDVMLRYPQAFVVGTNLS